jgi:hypothetical protein
MAIPHCAQNFASAAARVPHCGQKRILVDCATADGATDGGGGDGAHGGGRGGSVCSTRVGTSVRRSAGMRRGTVVSGVTAAFFVA